MASPSCVSFSSLKTAAFCPGSISTREKLSCVISLIFLMGSFFVLTLALAALGGQKCWWQVPHFLLWGEKSIALTFASGCIVPIVPIALLALIYVKACRSKETQFEDAYQDRVPQFEEACRGKKAHFKWNISKQQNLNPEEQLALENLKKILSSERSLAVLKEVYIVFLPSVGSSRFTIFGADYDSCFDKDTIQNPALCILIQAVDRSEISIGSIVNANSGCDGHSVTCKYDEFLKLANKEYPSNLIASIKENLS